MRVLFTLIGLCGLSFLLVWLHPDSKALDTENRYLSGSGKGAILALLLTSKCLKPLSEKL